MMKSIANNNNNNYNGFQPVSTDNVRLDAHDVGHDAHQDSAQVCDHAARDARISSASMPVHKRLLFDPLWFRWITTTIWAISVGVTFGVLGDFSMFNIFLRREFGSSVMELSWLGAVPWCLTCVFSPLSNVFTRALGYRLTMVISCLLCAVGLIATSFIHALWPAFISYSLLVGGGSVVIYTTGCVYVTQFFDKKHCTGPVSTGGMCFELAILIYSPVINVTANAWGWRWCLRLLGGIALVYTGFLFLFIRPPPRNLFVDADDDDAKDYKALKGDIVKVEEKAERVVTQAKEAKDDLEEDGRRGIDDDDDDDDDNDESGDETSYLRRYLELLRKPAFSVYMVGVVVSFITLSFTHINLGSYLTGEGVADDQLALMHSLLAGGATLGRAFVLLVHLLPFSIILTYPAIAVMAALCSVAVTVISQHWVFYGYSFLMGMLRGQYFALSTGIAVELSGRSRAAEAYASTFVAWGIGSALAAVLPGVTHQLTGSYKLAMVIGAALWGVSVILFSAMYVIHRRPRTRNRARRLESDPEGDVEEKGRRVVQEEHFLTIEKLSSV